MDDPRFILHIASSVVEKNLQIFVNEIDQGNDEALDDLNYTEFEDVITLKQYIIEHAKEFLTEGLSVDKLNLFLRDKSFNIIKENKFLAWASRLDSSGIMTILLFMDIVRMKAIGTLGPVNISNVDKLSHNFDKNFFTREVIMAATDLITQFGIQVASKAEYIYVFILLTYRKRMGIGNVRKEYAQKYIKSFTTKRKFKNFDEVVGSITDTLDSYNTDYEPEEFVVDLTEEVEEGDDEDINSITTQLQVWLNELPDDMSHVKPKATDHPSRYANYFIANKRLPATGDDFGNYTRDQIIGEMFSHLVGNFFSNQVAFSTLLPTKFTYRTTFLRDVRLPHIETVLMHLSLYQEDGQLKQQQFNFAYALAVVLFSKSTDKPAILSSAWMTDTVCNKVEPTVKANIPKQFSYAAFDTWVEEQRPVDITQDEAIVDTIAYNATLNDWNEDLQLLQALLHVEAKEVDVVENAEKTFSANTRKLIMLQQQTFTNLPDLILAWRAHVENRSAIKDAKSIIPMLTRDDPITSYIDFIAQLQSAGFDSTLYDETMSLYFFHMLQQFHRNDAVDDKEYYLSVFQSVKYLIYLIKGYQHTTDEDRTYADSFLAPRLAELAIAYYKSFRETKLIDIQQLRDLLERRNYESFFRYDTTGVLEALHSLYLDAVDNPATYEVAEAFVNHFDQTFFDIVVATPDDEWTALLSSTFKKLKNRNDDEAYKSALTEIWIGYNQDESFFKLHTVIGDLQIFLRSDEYEVQCLVQHLRNKLTEKTVTETKVNLLTFVTFLYKRCGMAIATVPPKPKKAEPKINTDSWLSYLLGTSPTFPKKTKVNRKQYEGRKDNASVKQIVRVYRAITDPLFRKDQKDMKDPHEIEYLFDDEQVKLIVNQIMSEVNETDAANDIFVFLKNMASVLPFNPKRLATLLRSNEQISDTFMSLIFNRSSTIAEFNKIKVGDMYEALRMQHSKQGQLYRLVFNIPFENVTARKPAGFKDEGYSYEYIYSQVGTMTDDEFEWYCTHRRKVKIEETVKLDWNDALIKGIYPEGATTEVTKPMFNLILPFFKEFATNLYFQSQNKEGALKAIDVLNKMQNEGFIFMVDALDWYLHHYVVTIDDMIEHAFNWIDDEVPEYFATCWRKLTGFSSSKNSESSIKTSYDDLIQAARTRNAKVLGPILLATSSIPLLSKMRESAKMSKTKEELDGIFASLVEDRFEEQLKAYKNLNLDLLDWVYLYDLQNGTATRYVKPPVAVKTASVKKAGFDTNALIAAINGGRNVNEGFNCNCLFFSFNDSLGRFGKTIAEAQQWRTDTTKMIKEDPEMLQLNFPDESERAEYFDEVENQSANLRMEHLEKFVEDGKLCFFMITEHMGGGVQVINDPVTASETGVIFHNGIHFDAVVLEDMSNEDFLNFLEYVNCHDQMMAEDNNRYARYSIFERFQTYAETNNKGLLYEDAAYVVQLLCFVFAKYWDRIAKTQRNPNQPPNAVLYSYMCADGSSTPSFTKHDCVKMPRSERIFRVTQTFLQEVLDNRSTDVFKALRLVNDGQRGFLHLRNRLNSIKRYLWQEAEFVQELRSRRRQMLESDRDNEKYILTNHFNVPGMEGYYVGELEDYIKNELQREGRLIPLQRYTKRDLVLFFLDTDDLDVVAHRFQLQRDNIKEIDTASIQSKKDKTRLALHQLRAYMWSDSEIRELVRQRLGKATTATQLSNQRTMLIDDLGLRHDYVPPTLEDTENHIISALQEKGVVQLEANSTTEVTRHAILQAVRHHNSNAAEKLGIVDAETLQAYKNLRRGKERREFLESVLLPAPAPSKDDSATAAADAPVTTAAAVVEPVTTAAAVVEPVTIAAAADAPDVTAAADDAPVTTAAAVATPAKTPAAVFTPVKTDAEQRVYRSPVEIAEDIKRTMIKEILSELQAFKPGSKPKNRTTFRGNLHMSEDEVKAFVDIVANKLGIPLHKFKYKDAKTADGLASKLISAKPDWGRSTPAPASPQDDVQSFSQPEQLMKSNPFITQGGTIPSALRTDSTNVVRKRLRYDQRSFTYLSNLANNDTAIIQQVFGATTYEGMADRNKVFKVTDHPKAYEMVEEVQPVIRFLAEKHNVTDLNNISTENDPFWIEMQAMFNVPKSRVQGRKKTLSNTAAAVFRSVKPAITYADIVDDVDEPSAAMQSAQDIVNFLNMWRLEAAEITEMCSTSTRVSSLTPVQKQALVAYLRRMHDVTELPASAATIADVAQKVDGKIGRFQKLFADVLIELHNDKAKDVSDDATLEYIAPAVVDRYDTWLLLSQKFQSFVPFNVLRKTNTVKQIRNFTIMADLFEYLSQYSSSLPALLLGLACEPQSRLEEDDDEWMLQFGTAQLEEFYEILCHFLNIENPDLSVVPELKNVRSFMKAVGREQDIQTFHIGGDDDDSETSSFRITESDIVNKSNGSRRPVTTVTTEPVTFTPAARAPPKMPLSTKSVARQLNFASAKKPPVPTRPPATSQVTGKAKPLILKPKPKPPVPQRPSPASISPVVTQRSPEGTPTNLKFTPAKPAKTQRGYLDNLKNDLELARVRVMGSMGTLHDQGVPYAAFANAFREILFKNYQAVPIYNKNPQSVLKAFNEALQPSIGNISDEGNAFKIFVSSVANWLNMLKDMHDNGVEFTLIFLDDNTDLLRNDDAFARVGRTLGESIKCLFPAVISNDRVLARGLAYAYTVDFHTSTLGVVLPFNDSLQATFEAVQINFDRLILLTGEQYRIAYDDFFHYLFGEENRWRGIYRTVDMITHALEKYDAIVDAEFRSIILRTSIGLDILLDRALKESENAKFSMRYVPSDFKALYWPSQSQTPIFPALYDQDGKLIGKGLSYLRTGSIKQSDSEESEEESEEDDEYKRDQDVFAFHNREMAKYAVLLIQEGIPASKLADFFFNVLFRPDLKKPQVTTILQSLLTEHKALLANRAEARAYTSYLADHIVANLKVLKKLKILGYDSERFPQQIIIGNDVAYKNAVGDGHPPEGVELRILIPVTYREPDNDDSEMYAAGYRYWDEMFSATRNVTTVSAQMQGNLDMMYTLDTHHDEVGSAIRTFFTKYNIRQLKDGISLEQVKGAFKGVRTHASFVEQFHALIVLLGELYELDSTIRIQMPHSNFNPLGFDGVSPGAKVWFPALRSKTNGWVLRGKVYVPKDAENATSAAVNDSLEKPEYRKVDSFTPTEVYDFIVSLVTYCVRSGVRIRQFANFFRDYVTAYNTQTAVSKSNKPTRPSNEVQQVIDHIEYLMDDLLQILNQARSAGTLVELIWYDIDTLELYTNAFKSFNPVSNLNAKPACLLPVVKLEGEIEVPGVIFWRKKKDGGIQSRILKTILALQNHIKRDPCPLEDLSKFLAKVFTEDNMLLMSEWNLSEIRDIVASVTRDYFADVPQCETEYNKLGKLLGDLVLLLLTLMRNEYEIKFKDSVKDQDNAVNKGSSETHDAIDLIPGMYVADLELAPGLFYWRKKDDDEDDDEDEDDDTFPAPLGFYDDGSDLISDTSEVESLDDGSSGGGYVGGYVGGDAGSDDGEPFDECDETDYATDQEVASIESTLNDPYLRAVYYQLKFLMPRYVYNTLREGTRRDMFLRQPRRRVFFTIRFNYKNDDGEIQESEVYFVRRFYVEKMKDGLVSLMVPGQYNHGELLNRFEMAVTPFLSGDNPSLQKAWKVWHEYRQEVINR